MTVKECKKEINKILNSKIDLSTLKTIIKEEFQEDTNLELSLFEILDILKENKEYIFSSAEEKLIKRAIRKHIVSILRRKYFDHRFKEVGNKDLYSIVYERIMDSFELKEYSEKEVEKIMEEQEPFFLNGLKKEYYKALLQKKLVLKQYPKYVDKSKMTKEIKEEIKRAIQTGSEIDLTDIYDKFNSISTEEEKRREEEIKKLRTKAAIEDVQNFYEKARKIKRRVIFHAGPTNSGKTYNAIQKFKEADRGVYLAPLRLLAREIYDDCEGMAISLITGEEVVEHPEETHVSSTIEMADFNKEYDIAVIDEIQMIEDPQRGAAWSRALMGINARVVYVIGSKNAEPIIRKIVEKCGDTLEVVEHKRLSSLTPIEEPIPFRKLKKGDALICFSRKEIYELKEIVEAFGLTTALVYGSLPPSTRLTQAELFNKGERDILIATDAIGYGLNLNIKRVILTSLIKYNGIEDIFLPDSLFKQIAGRAGRYGKHENGEVGFLKKETREYYEDNIHEFREYTKRLSNPLDKIESGIFFPEYSHLEEFSKVKDYKNSLANIIADYESYFIDKSGLFHMTDIEDFYRNAEIIDREGKGLSLEAKYKLAFAPLNRKSYEGEMIFISFIKLFQGGKLEKFEEFYSIKNLKKSTLLDLENTNKDLALYLWLAYRAEIDKDYINQLIDLYENIAERITKKLEIS